MHAMHTEAAAAIFANASAASILFCSFGFLFGSSAFLFGSSVFLFGSSVFFVSFAFLLSVLLSLCFCCFVCIFVYYCYYWITDGSAVAAISFGLFAFLFGSCVFLF